MVLVIPFYIEAPSPYTFVGGLAWRGGSSSPYYTENVHDFAYSMESRSTELSSFYYPNMIVYFEECMYTRELTTNKIIPLMFSAVKDLHLPKVRKLYIAGELPVDYVAVFISTVLDEDIPIFKYIKRAIFNKFVKPGLKFRGIQIIKMSDMDSRLRSIKTVSDFKSVIKYKEYKLEILRELKCLI